MGWPDYAELLENFTGSDGPLNSTYWGDIGGLTGGLQITSNACTKPGVEGVTYGSYWKTDQAYADAHAYITITALPSEVDDYHVRVYARLQLPATSITGYCAAIYYNGVETAWWWTILRVVDSTTFTSLAEAAINLTAGDKIGIACEGTLVKMYHYTDSWALLGSYDDAGANQITASGYLGITSKSTATILDDFYGGSGEAPAPLTASLSDSLIYG